MGFQRLFINKNRTLIVEMVDDDTEFMLSEISYRIMVDARPFSEFKTGTILKESEREFCTNFTELIDVNFQLFEEMLLKILQETTARIEMLKLDMLRSSRELNKVCKTFKR